MAPSEGGEYRQEDWCGRDLGAARFERTRFVDGDLTEVSTEGAVFDGCSLTGARFASSGLRPLHVEGAKGLFELLRRGPPWRVLRWSAARRVGLGNSRLDRASFRNASLSGANLHGATVGGAVFTGADVSGAPIAGISWRGVRIDARPAVLIAHSLGAVIKET